MKNVLTSFSYFLFHIYEHIGREGSYISSSGNSDNDAIPDEHTTMTDVKEGKRNPKTRRKKRKRRSREKNSTSKNVKG